MFALPFQGKGSPVGRASRLSCRHPQRVSGGSVALSKVRAPGDEAHASHMPPLLPAVLTFVSTTSRVGHHSKAMLRQARCERVKGADAKLSRTPRPPKPRLRSP